MPSVPKEKILDILIACKAMSGVCHGFDLRSNETVVAARAFLFMCEEAVKIPQPSVDDVQPVVARLIEDGLRAA